MDTARSITFEFADGVYIRTLELGDAQAVFEGVTRNADHLMEYMEWMKPDYAIDDARAFVERNVTEQAENKGLSFGIFREELLIGVIGLARFDLDARVTEIGYWIDKSEEGKGIVSRAVEALIDFAFAELEMNRIQIRCATTNVRSAAIPERFGFVKEGVQRQHVMRNGKLYDHAIYGLLASEWNILEL